MGPGKEDVVGATHKYCEKDANGAEDGEKGWVDDRQGDANEDDDWMDSRRSSSHCRRRPSPLGCVVVATARRFPSHSLARIIADVRTRNTRIAWARALEHPAESDHILGIDVSIAQHQRASDADDAGNAHI